MGIRTNVTARQRLAYLIKGNIDATLAANLPADPVGGDGYKVSVAGNFEGSALIDPAGAYFDVSNLVIWNAITSKWDKVDTTENISDTAYNAATWLGDTRDAPSKNAIRNKIVDMDASIGVVSNEADNIETAMGLNTDGAYIAHSGSNFIDGATTGKQAREILDAVLAGVSNELNTAEAGAGLAASGAYVTPVGTTFLGATTSLANADSTLDTVLTGISNEVNSMETALGLADNGSYVAHSGSSYMDSATTAKGARELLDAALTATDASLAIVSNELDTVESSVGLTATGAYSAHSGSSLLDTATTVKDALDKLDNGIGAVHPNGVEDATKFTVTYAAKVFTVTTTAGAAYWCNGQRYTPAAQAHNAAAHAAATGTYYAVWDGSTFTTTTSPNFQTQTLIAYVYFNNTTGLHVLFDERHPDNMPWTVHRLHHDTEGAQLVSGGAISGYTLDTNGDANTAFAIEQTVIDDESLRITNALLAAGGPYTVWYRSGTDAAAEWSWDVTPTVPFLHDGDDAYYNRLNAGSWSNVAVATNSNWVNYYLCATNAYNDVTNTKHRFILIMGQTLHATLAAARAASFLTGIAFSTMPFKEIVPLYKITYQHVNDAGNKDVQIDEVAKIIGTSISAITVANPTSHGSLSGRSDAGQHPASAVSTTFVGSTYLDAATDADTAFDTLDSQLASEAASLTALSGSLTIVSNELNTAEASLGLGSDGSFVAHSGSTYMDAATTAKQARELLDSAVSAVAGSLTIVSNELNTAETALGLNSNGTMPAFSGTNSLDAVTNHHDALIALDSSSGIITARTDATATVTVGLKSAGESYLIRSSYSATGTVAVALPAVSTVASNETHAIADIGYNASVNNITITPNGSDKIDNSASYLMDTDGEVTTIVANKATSNWEVV